MKKVLAACLWLVWAGLSGPAWAAENSLHLTLGVGGDSGTSTAGLYGQHTFDPWFCGAGSELRPLVNAGLYWWHDSKGGQWYGNQSHQGWRRPDDLFIVTGSFGLEWRSLSPAVQPYLSLQGGPSYISRDHFGERELGGHFIFNLRALAGLRFGEEMRHALSLHYTHFSNADLYDHNDGLNAYGLTYAYTF